MKKIYGHIYVCDDEVNATEKLIVENNGEVVNGPIKWFIKLAADVNLSPVYRRMLRSICGKTIVFKCDTQEQVEHILTEDIKTFGGYRID